MVQMVVMVLLLLCFSSTVSFSWFCLYCIFTVSIWTAVHHFIRPLNRSIMTEEPKKKKQIQTQLVKINVNEIYTKRMKLKLERLNLIECPKIAATANNHITWRLIM